MPRSVIRSRNDAARVQPWRANTNNNLQDQRHYRLDPVQRRGHVDPRPAHRKIPSRVLTELLENYDAKPSRGSFTPLETYLQGRLRDLLRDLELPLSGPWSAQILGKVYCPNRQKSNARVLRNFCIEANLMAEQISCTLTDDNERKIAMAVIEDFFLEFVNNKNNFASAEDGEQDFAVLAGYARSPSYMDYRAGGEVSKEIFAPVEATRVSKAVLKVLNEIFKPLQLRLDLRPWHYALFENFGSEDFSEGFVFESSMPFINKQVISETKESYGTYHNSDELIAHEMTHALLRQLGYEETTDPNAKSFVPDMSRAQVHEFIAFAAGIQFAPLPQLFNLLTQSDPDLLLRINPVRDLFLRQVQTFLVQQGSNFTEIYSGDLPINTERFTFDDFIQNFINDIGEDGLRRLENFIKKRFMSEAQGIVKVLQRNGAFDADVEHSLKNHLVIS